MISTGLSNITVVILFVSVSGCGISSRVNDDPTCGFSAEKVTNLLSADVTEAIDWVSGKPTAYATMTTAAGQEVRMTLCSGAVQSISISANNSDRKVAGAIQYMKFNEDGVVESVSLNSALADGSRGDGYHYMFSADSPRCSIGKIIAVSQKRAEIHPLKECVVEVK